MWWTIFNKIRTCYSKVVLQDCNKVAMARRKVCPSINIMPWSNNNKNNNDGCCRHNKHNNIAYEKTRDCKTSKLHNFDINLILSIICRCWWHHGKFNAAIENDKFFLILVSSACSILGARNLVVMQLVYVGAPFVQFF
jgi:hypothetical protein